MTVFFARPTEEDEVWMREAVRAAQGALRSAPNPPVGCVLVKDGVEIGRGCTQEPGGHHAEIEALLAAVRAGKNAKGATAYVTLEPCSFFGRTPPCASRLILEGVSRVVFAVRDPNPKVNGRGAEMLEAAGIDVREGACAAEAVETMRGFFARMFWHRPWVRMKTAQSIDGRTALPTGVSQWITGPRSRDDARRQRAQAQALITGSGTVIADDPQMTVRVPGLPDPRRYVMDSRASIPPTARILQGAQTTVFVTDEAPEDRVLALERAGARVVRKPSKDGHVDPRAALQTIYEDGACIVHLEAGARLSGAFLDAGLVDEIVLYADPVFLGAGQPAALIRVPEGLSEEQAPRWHQLSLQSVGGGLRWVLLRRPFELLFPELFPYF